MTSKVQSVQTLSQDRCADTERKCADAQWHFMNTGTYRAEDIIELLGDPRESVDVKSLAFVASARSEGDD